MKNKISSFLASFFTLGLLGALAATPAAAQVDLTRFVTLGDSYTAGFLDACWVKHGQIDSFGAQLARQAGADFQQPLLDEPGLGSGGVGAGKGCFRLTGFSSTGLPIIGNRDSVLKPLNLNLPRPYNNLAVPGYKVADVTDVKAAAQNGNPLTDLVLRGLGGGTTALQQAASLTPTFVSVFIGGNDVLGAVLNGTAIDGVTVTKVADFRPKYKQIMDTLKAAQGGTAKGIVVGLADVSALPFATTLSPYITVGGKTIPGPGGAPLTYLGAKGNDPTKTAPIPADALLTLNAAGFLPSGYGVPCAVLDAGGVPATSPLRANCNKPLPDSAVASLGIPGVILYPDEVALIKTRTAELTAEIKAQGEAAGYKFYDVVPFFDNLVKNGYDAAGLTVTTAFLSGGFFSYDGFHPTSLAWAIYSNDLIKFLNTTYGSSIPQVDLNPYLFNGDSSAGGFPTGAVPHLTPEETIEAAAQIVKSDGWAEYLQLMAPMPAAEGELTLDATDQPRKR